MVKVVGEIRPRRIVLGPRENLGDSSNLDCMFVSRDCAAAVSKPRSGVPVALAGHGK